MAIDREELKDRILYLLQKTQAAKGYYTDERMNYAIQDCIDYVQSHMHGSNMGFTNSIDDLNVTEGDFEVDLPTGTVMIIGVHYKVNDVWLPLDHRPKQDAPRYSTAGSDTKAIPHTFEVVGNKLHFDPPFSETGTGYLKVEVTKFDAILADDADTLPANLSRNMEHYIKWRSARQLSIKSYPSDWALMEKQWFDRVMFEINTRVRKLKTIREF